jgi:2-dehydropantoate 2-reductase
MRFPIMGAGGIGGYLGARLAAAGRDVAMVARGDHLAAMRDHGLRLESPLGDATVRVTATDHPAEIGPVDLVLFAVKLYDTEATAEACRPLLGAEGGVVTFQCADRAGESSRGGRAHGAGQAHAG